ncbi:MAG: hypothetical protein M1830_008116 [Pleopsidium flavum]|nr:MAG: hypothetical protein M1830_008116 [Pleopsidium flavum]
MKARWRPSWDVEGRKPAFISAEGPAIGVTPHGGKKYLWGNVPALDVLNLKQNEGVDVARDFRLLFAASGDMRNIVQSLTKLPTTYRGHCEVIVNDRDSDIVARNTILLLTALHFSPDAATPIMIHVWYSALVPAQVLHSLRDNILPLIQGVCTKIQAKPGKTLLSKTWTYGTRSLCLVLRKEQWDRLLSYFEVPNGLSMVQAQAIRASTTLAPERKDYVDRALYTQPPAWRVCTMKFRKDGILLPFGSSCKEFDTPNPTFYQTKDSWPLKDSADPLEGWPIDEVIQKAPPAKNDIYGSLFFYLQDVLSQFCRQIGRLRLSIQLFQVDALELPDILNQSVMGQGSFDRIELSNIADRGYLGPEPALATFGPLLKRHTQNPNATLVALFLNAVHEVFTPLDSLGSAISDMDRMRPYLPATRDMVQHGNEYNADFLRFMAARGMFRDFDELFKRYMRECRFHEVSKAAGLEMKSQNTIVRPWPMRLEKNATQREFDFLHASGHSGSERYAEWKSVA